MLNKILIGLLVTIGLTSFRNEISGDLSAYDSSVQSRFSIGINDGVTGAPGETSCYNCHFGGLQDGSSQHTFTVSQNGVAVSNYVPGQSYDVKLELTTGNVLEGFQATVLDLVNDDMAGSLSSSNTGTNIIQPSGTRQYVNHTVSSNMEGNPGWEWQWEAPTTDLGPVRFYVASNVANGDWNPENDFIYTSQYTIGSPLETEELTENISSFEVGYFAEKNTLHINLNSEISDVMFMNLINASGKSVLTQMIGQATAGSNQAQIQLPGHLESGVYVVHFFVGNSSISSTIRILSK